MFAVSLNFYTIPYTWLLKKWFTQTMPRSDQRVRDYFRLILINIGYFQDIFPCHSVSFISRPFPSLARPASARLPGLLCTTFAMPRTSPKISLGQVILCAALLCVPGSGNSCCCHHYFAPNVGHFAKLQTQLSTLSLKVSNWHYYFSTQNQDG